MSPRRLPLLLASLLALGEASCEGLPITKEDLQASLWGPETGYQRRTQPGAAWAARRVVDDGNASAEAAVDELQFNMQFQGILEVDTKLQFFTMDVWTRLVWEDWRLGFNGSCLKAGGLQPGQNDTHVVPLPLADLERGAWMPDVDWNTLMEEPEVIWARSWLFSTGKVWVTKRQIMKFSCKMSFEDMPFDLQHCGLPVRSAPMDALVLVEAPMGGLNITPREHSYLGGVVDWALVEEESAVEDVCEDMGSVLACDRFLKYTFVLRRDPVYFSLYFLAPMYFCVMLAWASFFISREQAPARVSLSSFTFLTLLGKTSSVLKRLPKQPGHVWLLDFLYVSLFFCLYAVLEYALANFLMRTEERVERARDSVLSCPSEEERELGIRTSVRRRAGRCDRCCVSRSGSVLVHDQHLDIFSRWAFPLAYAVVLARFYAVTP